MEHYEPTSRRPIADMFRLSAQASTRFCVRLGIHPNTISLSSMVAAGAAAICFVFAGRLPWLLIPASVFCFVRLWLNMLDGMVALASGKASKWGEVLNDLPDRVSDVLIFVGVAHSGLVNPFLGYWAAIASLLVAYVGTFGQALGVQREFSGVMAKPWRMVALAVGSALTLWGPDAPWMQWTLIAVLVGCVQSVVIRLKRILAALQADA